MTLGVPISPSVGPSVGPSGNLCRVRPCFVIDTFAVGNDAHQAAYDGVDNPSVDSPMEQRLIDRLLGQNVVGGESVVSVAIRLKMYEYLNISNNKAVYTA